jgi:hypothetical protein
VRLIAHALLASGQPERAYLNMRDLLPCSTSIKRMQMPVC